MHRRAIGAKTCAVTSELVGWTPAASRAADMFVVCETSTGGSPAGS